MNNLIIEDFEPNLTKYCIFMLISNAFTYNLNILLSDYKNIIHTICQQLPLFSSQLKKILEMFYFVFDAMCSMDIHAAVLGRQYLELKYLYGVVFLSKNEIFSLDEV